MLSKREDPLTIPDLAMGVNNSIGLLGSEVLEVGTLMSVGHVYRLCRIGAVGDGRRWGRAEGGGGWGDGDGRKTRTKVLYTPARMGIRGGI